jgi:dUTPase
LVSTVPLHDAYYDYGLLRAKNILTGLPKELWSGFPDLTAKQMAAFLAGYLEEVGHLTTPTSPEPTLLLIDDDEEMLRGFAMWTGIAPCEAVDGRYIKYTGYDALDAAGKVYSNTAHGGPIRETLFKWLQKPKVEGKIKWSLTLPDAVAPSKTRVTDSGYDLTLVKYLHSIGSIHYYDTGVQVEPPFGVAFYLMARSSLTKTGFGLANSVGVIDRTYRGNIIVPLVRLDPKADSIWPPLKVVQLVPLLTGHFDSDVVRSEDLSKTNRAEKGFGSTDGETKG